MSVATLPRAFIWRRVHSLLGLWLLLFLLEHLFVNSQAALLIGDNGQGFVRAVNAIHNLPYLYVIEAVLLGVPLLLHFVWGIKRVFTAKANSRGSDGSRPSLGEYGRNRAFTWQRWTSWILLIGLVAHVAKFRFLEYPWSVGTGENTTYFVCVQMDKGLYTVASRLGVELYDVQKIGAEKQELEKRQGEKTLLDVGAQIKDSGYYEGHSDLILTSAQQYLEKQEWVRALSKYELKTGFVIAASKSFGTATLLSVRDTFKSPIYCVLYTIFVLAACFHAFNGLWTFLLTWGIVLKMSAQKSGVTFAWAVMAIVIFLGLSAIWGTYYLNLKS